MARRNTKEELSQITVALSETKKFPIIEALQSSASPEIRFCEIIDNARAKTPEGETCNVILELNAKKNYFSQWNFPATLMSIEEAKLLNTLGRDADERQYGTPSLWGIGGMTSLLVMSNETKGNLELESPFEDGDYMLYRRPNWHKNIDADVPIFHSQRDTEPFGVPSTFILLENLDPRTRDLNINRVADYLGLAYSMALQSGDLNIELRHQPKGKSTTKTIEIKPLEIPWIDHPEYSEILPIDPREANKPIKKIVGPYMEIWHGKVDQTSVTAHDRDRDKTYAKSNRHPDTTLFSQAVLIYHEDRLLETTTLRKLKVPRATDKFALDNLITIARIALHPEIVPSQFKTTLDGRSPMTQLVYDTIRTYLEPVVKETLDTTPEPENLTAQYENILNLTHSHLQALLGNAFQTSEDITNYFLLPTTFLSDDISPEVTIEETTDQMPRRRGRRRSQKGESTILPGMGRSRGPRDSVVVDGEIRVYEHDLEIPIPPMIVEESESGTPIAIEERRIGNSDLLTIILNANNQLIRDALHTPTNQPIGKEVIISKTLEALLHRSGKEMSQPEIDLWVNDLLQHER